MGTLKYKEYQPWNGLNSGIFLVLIPLTISFK